MGGVGKVGGGGGGGGVGAESRSGMFGGGLPWEWYQSPSANDHEVLKYLKANGDKQSAPPTSQCNFELNKPSVKLSDLRNSTWFTDVTICTWEDDKFEKMSRYSYHLDLAFLNSLGSRASSLAGVWWQHSGLSLAGCSQIRAQPLTGFMACCPV